MSPPLVFRREFVCRDYAAISDAIAMIVFRPDFLSS
jgi:hypothetical protein